MRTGTLLAIVATLACTRAKDHAAPAAVQTRPPRPEVAARPSVTLYPDGHPAATVEVELAVSEPERERGLMYHQHLAPDAGMLFLFDQNEDHTFWMKNTLIALDMIFIRGDLTVAGVVERAAPLTLEPRTVDAPSRYVLEVNGGWAREHGVASGTRVRFDHVSP